MAARRSLTGADSGAGEEGDVGDIGPKGGEKEPEGLAPESIADQGRDDAESAAEGASGHGEAEADSPEVPLHRYALVIYQGHGGTFAAISSALASHVRDLLEESVTSEREETEIDVWLDTPGGDAHAAYKMGILLRAYAKKIRIVIPDYAKSAGTLLALVGDEIYMAPAAELGPLDAQINYEQEGFTISALDRGKSLDDLISAAMNLALSGGAHVLNYTRLSRAESLSAMLDFSAKFMSPVVSKLDPTIIHWSNTLLEVAVEYGERLLASRNVGVDATTASIPRLLVERYPTHGFVISAQEATQLGLPVQPMRNYQFEAQAKSLHRQHEEVHESVVELFDLSPSLSVTSDHPEGDTHVREG